MSDHLLHLDSISANGPQFRLECHSIKVGHDCPATDSDLPGQCAAISWLENCDWDDLIQGDFVGASPWMVDVTWPHPEGPPIIEASKETE